MRKQEQRKLFGARLRELRLKLGVSQEALAELAGLHRNYVGVLERAQQSPSLDAIVRLAKALKVKPADLLSKFSWKTVRRSSPFSEAQS